MPYSYIKIVIYLLGFDCLIGEVLINKVDDKLCKNNEVAFDLVAIDDVRMREGLYDLKIKTAPNELEIKYLTM